MTTPATIIVQSGTDDPTPPTTGRLKLYAKTDNNFYIIDDAGVISVLGGFSGAYGDLTGLPTLFDGTWASLTGVPTLFSGAYGDLTGAPTLFSGAYGDLTGLPTLFSGAYGDLTGLPVPYFTHNDETGGLLYYPGDKDAPADTTLIAAGSAISLAATAQVVGGETGTGTGGAGGARGGGAFSAGGSGGLAFLAGGGANTGNGNGGNVALNGGSVSGTGQAGHILISGGTHSGTGQAGRIRLSTNEVVRFDVNKDGTWSLGTAGTNVGTAGQVITSSGTGAPPTWTSAGVVPTLTSQLTNDSGFLTLISSSHKEAVRAATTANIALTGNVVMDGLTTAAGNRILVKNQTTASENGLYVASATAWARAADADIGSELSNGTIIPVQFGTVNAGSLWTLTTNGGTIGNSFVFTRTDGRAALTGDVTKPLDSVVTTLATVNSNVGSFGSSTSIPSFTVNAKGLVTAASGNVVIAPAGTLTGTTLAAGVTSSSLTSVGTLTNLTVTNPITGSIIGKAGSVTTTLYSADASEYQMVWTDNTTGGTLLYRTATVTISPSNGRITATALTTGTLTTTGKVGMGAAPDANARLLVDSGAVGLNTIFNSAHANGLYTSYQNAGTPIGDIGAGAQVLSGGSAGNFTIASRAGTLILGTNNVERLGILSNGAWSVGTGGAATGTSGQVLQSTGATTPPVWTTPSGGGGTSMNVQVFTGNGTWTKPANALRVSISLVGGGGGGGGGNKMPADTAAVGGTGAGGGGTTYIEVPAAVLGGTESVVVGTGGAGGVGKTGADGTGASGADGTASTIAGFSAAGGVKGISWTSGTALGGLGGSGLYSGSSGGTATVTTSVGGTASNLMGAGGGGAGGGLNGSNVSISSGAGGSSAIFIRTTALVGGAGGASNTNGTAGGSAPSNTALGGAGGGGGGTSTGIGGTGGAGGLYGGGGGGGGGGRSFGKDGGVGASGLVIVTTFCST